jgi:signal transduction histidine kinase/CheY-like chemotaxis protein/HPt (histidine-containing phosphotransfer) domain-containing protein
MDKTNIISGLKDELDLLQEKLSISQSLVKLGIWEFNRETLKIHLSEEARRILNLGEDKTCISIEDFGIMIGQEKRQWLKNSMNTNGTETLDLDFEVLIEPNTNDSEKWIKVIVNSSTHSKKDPNLVFGIVQDISEQKKNEILLKKAKERAEEADFLKSVFLANMSHEIRTPLNAILGFSQLLTNKDIPDIQRNEYSQYITSSANNLLNLVRDIIDVSKIEAGIMVIEKKECEVNKVLEELKFTFEKEKMNNSKDHIEIKLNKALSNDNFSIVTDPFRFHQIMVNLIGNALKFIETGFIEFGYRVLNPDCLQFYVKDTGIGIPEDKIELIFSRFGQIIDNKLKNPGGTGLGLSITKHLVERLGGTIWVDSRPGEGTTFYFTLPFILIETNKRTIKTKDKANEFELINLRILAVEDDNINMVLLEDLLKLEITNVEIVKAFNGIEAIEQLMKSDFDLIIMDVRMPQMDGYEATEFIRTKFKSPTNQIPILGLSAHALKEEIEKGQQIGMSDFLSKPIIPKELLLKIKKLIYRIPDAKNAQAKIEVKNEETVQQNVLDICILQDLLKNDKEKINKTLAVYLEQIPGQMKSLNEACNNGNKEKLRNISHSLKSTFKYIGRSDLSEIAREIERDIDPESGKELILDKIDLINKDWLLIERKIRQMIYQS